MKETEERDLPPTKEKKNMRYHPFNHRANRTVEEKDES